LTLAGTRSVGTASPISARMKVANTGSLAT